MLERHPQAESHPSGERVVVFHKTTKNSIVLNPTGSWIWDQLEKPRSRDWLLEQMTQRHPEVESDTLQKDLEAYLQELTTNELIVPS